jgi:ribonuclease-3
MQNLAELEKKLGLKFRNLKLLAQALVHRSYLNESQEPGLNSNERLEFLGDAILEYIISRWLYERFPDFSEGNLTNLRSNLVQKTTLAEIATRLSIGENLLMSKGERESGGKENPSLLADSLEAIIGAIYLDLGIEAVRTFIKANFTSTLSQLIERGQFKDFKSLLQEKIQAMVKEPPVYQTIREEGPDHNKIFTIAVYSNHKILGEGRGRSKQEAEEQAAKAGFEKLEEEND